jgi:3-oxoadipate enol-lactonase
MLGVQETKTASCKIISFSPAASERTGVPTTTHDGVTLYYETDGEGETVAFISEAGYGAWQWGWQPPSIAGVREALVWDLRGTGRSDAPPGPYDIDTLAADFEVVLREAGVRRAHVVGAGLGGMIALRHAREYDRGRTLTLLGTAPRGEAIDVDALRALYPDGDDVPACRESLAGAFSPAFRQERADLVEQICEWRQAEDADPAALDAQVDAMTSFEAGPLYELTVPALVCHGVEDPVVPPAAGEQLAEDLPRGTYEPVAGRHLAFVERARAVTDRLAAHFEAYE